MRHTKLFALALLLLLALSPVANAYTCAKGSLVTIGAFGGACRFFETATSASNQTDTWPSDWTNTNLLESIGGGGASDGPVSTSQTSGGCGGAYNFASNVTTFTASQTATFFIGVAATTATTQKGADGSNVYLCNSSSNCASIAGTAVQVGSKGGGGGVGNSATVCTQALASAGIPTTHGNNGGIGGHSALSYGGTGGGGAGGPNGAGANGASSVGTAQNGGNGGGAASGGAAGSNQATTTGGAGGVAFDSTAGGTGSAQGNPTTNGGTGSHGSGGGGSGGNSGTSTAAGTHGGIGGAGIEWDSSHGAGGGGGGSGGSSSLVFIPGVGGTGGLYGGGGGAPGVNVNWAAANTQGALGPGAQGILVITYQSSTFSPPPPTNAGVFLQGFP